jgi:hypothetical protein
VPLPRTEGQTDYYPHIQQSLLKIENGQGRLDERTENFRRELETLGTDLKGKPGSGQFWGGVGLICAVLIGLASAYWLATAAKLEAIEARLGATIQSAIADAIRPPAQKPRSREACMRLPARVRLELP